jgi:hypothetical protein
VVAVKACGRKKTMTRKTTGVVEVVEVQDWR